MSGLLERIARRRRASSEDRSDAVSAATRVAIPVGRDAPPAIVRDLNGTVSGRPSPHDALSPNGNGAARAEAEVLEPVSAASAPAAVAPPTPEEPAPVAGDSAAAHPADTTVDEVDQTPDFRERGRLRRRARYLRRLREVQLRDLGGLLLELHRFGRERPDLIEAKLAVASTTDRELHTLEQVLGLARAVRELREPGIGGACMTCGAVHGSTDRFCAACGRPLHREIRLEEPERRADLGAERPDPAP